jgi:peptidoglycan/LPS O-acetylase OafA/YrhL
VWYLPLVPVAALCLLSFSALKWFETRPETKPEVRDPILAIGFIYRVAALVMSLWWVHRYVPAREQFWVLAALGLALFLAAGWRRKQELLWFGAAFTLVGLINFWLAFDDMPTVYWPNFVAILVLLGQQQFAKRVPDRYRLPKEIHAGVIVVGGLSLWLLVSRWILQQTSGFYLTVGWSALALVLFIAGMATRERVYRWLGLAVLACAMGRVVIFDVWKLETLYRIFTFMALGVVLLILGFIYNKYQEKIKEWL